MVWRPKFWNTSTSSTRTNTAGKVRKTTDRPPTANIRMGNPLANTADSAPIWAETRMMTVATAQGSWLQERSTRFREPRIEVSRAKPRRMLRPNSPPVSAPLPKMRWQYTGRNKAKSAEPKTATARSGTGEKITCSAIRASAVPPAVNANAPLGPKNRLTKRASEATRIGTAI